MRLLNQALHWVKREQVLSRQERRMPRRIKQRSKVALFLPLCASARPVQSAEMVRGSANAAQSVDLAKGKGRRVGTAKRRVVEPPRATNSSKRALESGA
jgi:hypothetical protein